MQAVADDRDTAVAEMWQLRDAYTPAEDALGELLPSAHRLNDVHAGMLTDGGARLQLATGPVVVPPHMRKVLTAVCWLVDGRRLAGVSRRCAGVFDGSA